MSYFETTCLLGSALAAALVGWRLWLLSTKKKPGPYERPASWRVLYQEALLERRTGKIALRIQQAESAILVEFANQLFSSSGGDDSERATLQNAMSNLRNLRHDCLGSPVEEETRRDR